MSRLIVIGGGGHGRVVADSARGLDVYDTIVFLDDAPDRMMDDGEFTVIGSCTELESVIRPGDSCIVAIGDNRNRAGLIERVLASGLPLATIVDRSASVGSACELGPGTVVLPQAAVNIGTKLGTGCIVNTGATVDHDCQLGDHVHVAPGAHLGGGVGVGSGTWIGIGACVRHGISIGRDVVVGAGAAVVDDVDDGLTVVGVPARRRDRTA